MIRSADRLWRILIIHCGLHAHIRSRFSEMNRLAVGLDKLKVFLAIVSQTDRNHPPERRDSCEI